MNVYLLAFIPKLAVGKGQLAKCYYLPTVFLPTAN